MTALSEEVNLDIECHARLALDEDPRRGTGRAAGPSRTWLEARQAAERAFAEADFIRSGADKSQMRPVCVVPGNIEVKLAIERAAPERDYRKQARAFSFERADESLHDGNAALLADGAKPLADAIRTAPAYKALTIKLPATVSDQMLGHRASASNDFAEETAH